MPPLDVSCSARPHDAPPRRSGTRRALAAAAAVLLASASPLAAQTSLSHTEDAIPIPGGWFRLTVGNAWTRYDSRFGADGTTRGLGDELSTDSLGPRQLPGLAPIEGAVQTLTNNPLQRLTFGRLDVRSDARVVTTPLSLEYGVTRRFTLGVVVPLVQTRRYVQARVNQRASSDTTKTSNYGFIAAGLRDSAAARSLRVVTAFGGAGSSLNALLGRCAQNPAASECDPVRGREAAAAAAAARATAFAGAVQTAYGIKAADALVAPLAGSTLAKTIESQRAALVAQLATYTQIAADTLPTVATEFSYLDLQGRSGSPGLLQSTLGGGLDSIATTERIWIGDVEVRARVLLLDHTQRDTMPMRGAQYRLAVGGIVRFNTSHPDSARNLVDIGTGEGAGFEIRPALDVSAGRVGATVAARFGRSTARTVNLALVGYPIGGFPYPLFGEVSRKGGDVLGLDVSPRVFVSDWLSFEGEYGYERVGAPTFSGVDASPCSACTVLANSVLAAEYRVQRLGAGVRFSTVDAYLRGRARYPIDVSYRHLETITGDAGAPKLFRDQIQVRIYYRLWR